MRVNPTSEDLTLEDVFAYQTERAIDSVTNNPEAVYGEFDILNSAAQAITLMMLGDDPELRTVPKSRVYSLLLLERIPDDLIPGAVRETPFNFLDPTDPAAMPSVHHSRGRPFCSFVAVAAVIGFLNARNQHSPVWK